MNQSTHCLAVLTGSAFASLCLIINERDTELSLETIKKQEIVVGMTLVAKLKGTLAVQPHIDFYSSYKCCSWCWGCSFSFRSLV